MLLPPHHFSFDAFMKAVTVQTRWKTYKAFGKTSEIIQPTHTYSKDVLIFKHNKPFRLRAGMACLAGISVFLASVGSTFSFIGEKLASKGKSSTNQEVDTTETKKYFLDFYKFKNGKYHFAISTFFYGLAVLCGLGIVLIPPRYVKSIVLMKGGKTACVSTYAPFGSTKHIVVPSTQINATHQVPAGSSMTIKIGKYKIPYYISGNGEILNTAFMNELLRR